MGLTKPRAAQIYNLDYKQSTRVVTVSNVTLSGGAPATVDGVTLSLNDRILVTAQSTASQNGLYYVTTVGSGSNGTWARTSDGNETGEIEAGMIVMVTAGTIYADTQWKLTTDDPITVGSTSLTFVQNYSANSISSGTSNVVVTSNANVTISSAGTANVVNVGNTAVTFTGNVFPSANVTYSLGNTALRWKDLWLANSTLYIGDVAVATIGSALTINGSNVLTGNAGAAFSTSGNITGGNILTGGLISATGNVTGGNVVTTGAMSTTGNAVVGNILTNGYYYANGVVFGGGGGGTPGGANTQVQFNDNGVFGGSAGLTFNKTTNTVATTGAFSTTGNITGGNLSVTSIAGTLTTAAQTNITSLGTLGSLAVTGNTTSGNFVGTLNGSGANVTSISATNISAGTLAQARLANAAVTLGSTALTLGATVTTVAGLTSVTSGTISATGNITGGNLIQGTTRVMTWTTVANTAPTNAVPGDFWYNSYNDVKYQYTNDGTSNVWVDQSAPTSFTTITVGNVVNAGANGVGNIGSASGYFNTVFAKATSAQYADLAEMYVADQDYPAGTVVEFGGEFEITASTQTHSTRTAGVISTNPSYLMNSEQKGEHVLPVALTGRVPCHVVGTVGKGDRLVASAISGVATRLNKNLYEPGCIIGKALEDYNSDDVGIIEIAVGRY
jgi:hypothetical protein